MIRQDAARNLFILRAANIPYVCPFLYIEANWLARQCWRRSSTVWQQYCLTAHSFPDTFIGPPSSFSATAAGDVLLATFAQGPYSAALAFLMSQSPTQPLVKTVGKLRMKIIHWQARWIADVLRSSEACYTPESLGARLDAPFDV